MWCRLPIYNKTRKAEQMVRHDIRGPSVPHGTRLQVAALCLRQTDGGQQVLMVTSRGTGRWIMPKGWPIAGRSTAEAALQEAWEEGGVIGSVATEPVGSYAAVKVLASGVAQPCLVTVHPVTVTALADSYPEMAQRRRVWMAPEQAALSVEEDGLRALLRSI